MQGNLERALVLVSGFWQEHGPSQPLFPHWVEIISPVCVGENNPEKCNQLKCTDKTNYFKELAHGSIVVGKPEICGAGRQAGVAV
jgi:hypothetical protein